MNISEFQIGEFYTLNPRTRKKALTRISENWGLTLVLTDTIEIEENVYKKSYYQYLGKKTVKIEKRLDSKRKEVYTYRPHLMLCLQTGEICKVAGFYLRNFFIKY
jgi:hypothetical protein